MILWLYCYFSVISDFCLEKVFLHLKRGGEKKKKSKKKKERNFQSLLTSHGTLYLPHYTSHSRLCGWSTGNTFSFFLLFPLNCYLWLSSSSFWFVIECGQCVTSSVNARGGEGVLFWIWGGLCCFKVFCCFCFFFSPKRNFRRLEIAKQKVPSSSTAPC